jgi:hypothetical protein
VNFREGTRRLALLLGLAGAIAGGSASYLELQPVLSQRAAHKRFEQLANSDVVEQERKTLQAWKPVDESSNEGFQYIKLPDGDYGKFRADADDASIIAAIERDFPKTKPWSIYQSLAERTGGPGFIPDPATQNQKTPPAPAPYTKQQGRYGPEDLAQSPADPWATAAKEYRQEQSEVNEGGIKTIYWNKGHEVYSIETEDGETLFPTPAPSALMYLLIAILPVLGFFIPWGAVRAIGWVGAGFIQPSK